VPCAFGLALKERAQRESSKRELKERAQRESSKRELKERAQRESQQKSDAPHSEPCAFVYLRICAKGYITHTTHPPTHTHSDAPHSETCAFVHLCLCMVRCMEACGISGESTTECVWVGGWYACERVCEGMSLHFTLSLLSITERVAHSHSML